MLPPISQRPTWAEIKLNNLAQNFHSVKQFVGDGVEYMAVVKANAYGHGAVECAKRLESEGVDWFAVAIPEEGVELRRSGITSPILCLGGFWEGQEGLLLEHDLTTVIYSMDLARKLNSAAHSNGLCSRIHIKIDTGMGRVGFRCDEIEKVIAELKELRNLDIEGVMTHFAAADDLTENDFTDLQMDRFNTVVESFARNGFIPKYKDLANSPGAIAHKKARGNMVRLGGVLYGLGGDVLPREIKKPDLLPVLSLHTRIAQLKAVPKGETLGYGRTFETSRPSVIATIPIGYNDGLERNLSNRGFVLINGRLAPMIGRVSMDWTLIDVSEIPNVKVTDEVIIIGSQLGQSILAEDLSKLLGTISYEITCGIGSRVPRIFNET